MRYVADKLREPSTYVIAFVVGSLINLYGHVLVPWVRGEDSPLDRFQRELAEHPFLVTFSILLAYGFPIIVGTLSSVLTRHELRRFESLAAFPNRKPDPVFRAAPDGQLVEMGEATRTLFTRHAVERAQDVLGEDLWDAIRSSTGPRRAELFYCERLSSWYLLRHAPAEDGHVNAYLTETSPPADFVTPH